MKKSPARKASDAAAGIKPLQNLLPIEIEYPFGDADAHADTEGPTDDAAQEPEDGDSLQQAENASAEQAAEEPAEQAAGEAEQQSLEQVGPMRIGKARRCADAAADGTADERRHGDREDDVIDPVVEERLGEKPADERGPAADQATPADQTP